MGKLLYALTDGKNVFDVKDFTFVEFLCAEEIEKEKKSGLFWKELG